jgi:glycosyltransferase involved in cell wall biosynthesis
MRIAQLHWAALPTTGGVETHLAALVAGLRAAGEAVTFFSGTRNAQDALFHPALEPGGRHSDADLADLAEAVSSHDVLHLHNPQWHRPATVDALLAGLTDHGWRGACVATVHNLADDPRHAQWLRRWAVPLVAHSPFVAGELRANVAGTPVHLLPLALPADSGAVLPDYPGDGPVVLQPTRLSAWKGSHLTLAATVDLLDAGRALRFVHAGSEHLLWPPGIDASLMERIQPWQRCGAVRLVHYSPEHSWAAIRSADLVVHPTAGIGARGEPYSMSVAQAMLCGRPLVVSRSGNLPELVRGYRAARVVEPGDPDGLRKAIDAFLAGDWPSTDALSPDTANLDATRRLRAWHAGAVGAHRGWYRTLCRRALGRRA